ncbi:MAG: RNA polymerase sigma factor RpoD/SigA [Candidatus Eisenbacteria bacterium]|nr:RNA polymerase sigma factor RpoD/SigA [Candidatus Eisenbacteria bacterium]
MREHGKKGEPGENDRTLKVYLERIARVPLLAPDEELRLARRLREGDENAFQQLVQANLRFVVSVAKKYRNQGLAFSDLIDEGNIGLITAARRFDPERGNRFISYAVWWIRQAILKALADQARLIRLPLGKSGSVQKILRETDRLRQAFGREPSLVEVADAVALSEEEIRETMDAASFARSLEAPEFGEEGESALQEFLEDRVTPAPDRNLIEDRLRRDVRSALGDLLPREADVIRSYFGFDGTDGETLEEIGHRMNLSRERVRQIKEQAMSRIRRSNRGEALRSYLAA